MFSTICHNRFVANANKGFKNAIAYIIIRCIFTSMYLKNEQFFVFYTLYLQVDLRHWVYTLLYFLTDKFCVSLGIIQTYDSVIIGNTKQQATATSVGKGADALQPTFHFTAFHLLLFVVFGSLTYIFCYVHIYFIL